MYILNIICSDYALAHILIIIQGIINILRIIVPIFIIIGISIVLVKGVINPEDSKTMKRIGTSIASGIIVLVLPFIINVIMEVISTYGDVGLNENGNNVIFNISTCWNNANLKSLNMDSYSTTNQSVSNEKKSNSNSSNKSNSNKKNTSSNNSSNKSNSTSSNKSNSTSSNKSNSTSSNKSNSTAKNNSSTKTYKKVVLVGDSRFYGQKNYNLGNKNTSYIAKSSQGLSYLKQVTNQMKKKDTKQSAFVINLGVNDLYNVNNYISYINSLTKQFKGDIYYLSVNPVDEQKEYQNGYSVKNEDIDTFNSKMKNGLKNVKYLDSNSYLKENGFSTTDGVHYDKKTYTKIYNYIDKNVKS